MKIAGTAIRNSVDHVDLKIQGQHTVSCLVAAPHGLRQAGGAHDNGTRRRKSARLVGKERIPLGASGSGVCVPI